MHCGICEDIFHPAKFDNFKDEKNCLSTRQKLAGLKTVGLGQLLKAVFFLCFGGQKKFNFFYYKYCRVCTRVSVQGVESLWADCRFIPADWGS
jgi:hypothetical protein